jgi:hypothetical protein
MARTQTYRTAAVGYAGALACMAAAETVVGDLDRLDDVEAISAGAGRLVANGLIHLAGGVLLVVAVVGLVELVRGSVMGRIGWWVLAVSAPCAGAFAMLHLLAVETAAPALDGAAMEQFLVERLGQGAGAWAVPIAVFALLAPLGHVLLTAALARRHVVSWAAPALVLLGAVGHAVLGTGTTEIASLLTMAAGGLVAGWNLWSGTTVRREEPVLASAAA